MQKQQYREQLLRQTLLREIGKISGKKVSKEQPEDMQHVSSSSNRPTGSQLKTTLDPMKESMDEFKLSVKKVELP